MARDGGVQRVVDQRRFARAGDAGDADEQSDRQIERHLLQVVAAGVRHHQLPFRVGRAALFGDGDRAASGQVLAGERVFRQPDFFRRAFGDDFAAVHARAGAHVDHVVGGADRVFVVLDHQHGVADVAQVLQRGQQAVVVALVQADRRFVEHVHHAGQARADLRRKPDALRLAARQRFGRAVERQVIEPDVVQELQPVDDLLDDAVGDLARFAPCQRQRVEKRQRLRQRHRADS